MKLLPKTITQSSHLADSSVSGMLVDVCQARLYPAILRVNDGRISEIVETTAANTSGRFLVPLFVDAHQHPESSLLSPPEAARLALVGGCGASVYDPHEIANVCGDKGIEWMLEQSRRTPYKSCFMVPSCIPALPGVDVSGARFDTETIIDYLEREEFHGIAELMNFPGVIAGHPDILRIVHRAQQLGKAVDGHAPGIRGSDVVAYARNGPTTDHESTSLDEASEKLRQGIRCILRWGSAACDFHALHPLLKSHPGEVFFCTDDAHPDLLLHGGIRRIVATAIGLGYSPIDVIRSATLLPREHYKLQSLGMLQAGDALDFNVVESLEEFAIAGTYLDGMLVAADGRSLLPPVRVPICNNFHAKPVTVEQCVFPTPETPTPVIVIHDGQLRTSLRTLPATSARPSLKHDLLQLLLISRYDARIPPAHALVTGFTANEDFALASSIGHDNHNIGVVGSTPELLAKAANLVIENKGGIAFFTTSQMSFLHLPIAGLMSDREGSEVIQEYLNLQQAVAATVIGVRDPCMMLSFLFLLCIGDAKLGFGGIFNVSKFSFITNHDGTAR